MSKVPENIAAEERMIGSMILGSYQDAVDAGVTSEWFWGGDCNYLFRCMEKLADDGKPVDEAGVRFAVHKDRKPHLNNQIESCIQKGATKANWAYWLPDLKQALYRRRMFQAAYAMRLASEREDITIDEVVEKADSSLSELRVEQDNHTQTQKESVRELADFLSRLYEKGGRDILGFPSGFHDIDRALGGLRRQHLVIVAARPAVGKTSLVTNMAVKMAQKGVKVGFFSLEMSRQEINARCASVIGRVNFLKILQKEASEGELLKFTKALGEVANLPLTINDKGGVPINYIRQCARRMVRDGAKVIFVDYLQLIKSTKTRGTRNDEITEISTGLKAMAKELNVPVVALSQMNRDFEKKGTYKGKEVDRKPRMSDLRDGGSIEQDADTIGFLHKGEHGIVFYIAKSRHGQSFIEIPLVWIPEQTRFESMAKDRGRGSGDNFPGSDE